AGMSRTAETGVAVANFCIVLLFLQWRALGRPVVSDERKATLHSQIWQRIRCARITSPQLRAGISLQWL
ncbi:hypothetical protein AB0O22_34515, partial [Streptomyces sp. NPDC091204]|uniref:hypothetical protein n=1 Tax=Streptomyces sp. NPDC091204 TaxID=3155299 RepID=UPI003439398D